MGNRDRIVRVTGRKQEAPGKTECERTKPNGQKGVNCESYGKKARGSGENQMLAYKAQ